MRQLFILVALVSFASGSQAQTQPKVAFIGGNFTFNWEHNSAFRAHSNWQLDGVSEPPSPGPCHESTPTLAALQKIINSGQKPIIHLITGQGDVDGVTAGNQGDFIFESFAHCFEQIVTLAQNAKLKIIVGTDAFAVFGDIRSANQWVRLYCAAHNIPLVDYQFILYSDAANPTYSEGLWAANSAGLNVLNQAGYDLITAAAEVAIGQVAGTLSLKSGYLGTTTRQDFEDAPVEQGVNTVLAGSPIWFQAYGQWSDGITRVINNPNVNPSNTDAVGVMGTWSTSNPYVMSVDQTGYAKALRPGTASIKFTTLSGATLNLWTMNVVTSCPVSCTGVTY